MAVKITDIEIACDACLDETILSDVNQEVGFLGEEKMDFLDTQSKTGDPLLVLYQQEMLMDQVPEKLLEFVNTAMGQEVIGIVVLIIREENLAIIVMVLVL